MNKANLKVPLQRRKKCWHAPSVQCVDLISALPYWRSRQGTYFHRVRSGQAHYYNGKYSHTSFSMWCGMGGSLGKKGFLASEVPDDGILCATCEGKAIGAGMDGARIINGRNVMLSPRRPVGVST